MTDKKNYHEIFLNNQYFALKVEERQITNNKKYYPLFKKRIFLKLIINSYEICSLHLTFKVNCLCFNILIKYK